MKRPAKIFPPLLSLIVVGAILLISDLSNREHSENPDDRIEIAFVHWVHAPFTEKIEEGLMDGLRDQLQAAYSNLTTSRYNAGGDIAVLNSICQQVQQQKPDAIIVSCTPALQAAVNVISDIPVIYTAVADPILAGAGIDDVNHLRNITGVNVECDFETMCLLLTESAPQIKLLGSLFCPGEIISVQLKNNFIEIAKNYGLQVRFFPVNNASELPDAVLSMVNSKIDAVCQMGDNLLSSGISTLIKGVINAGLPYFEFNPRPPGTPMESLIQIDVDYYQNGYDAAILASQIILNHASPGDIPFQKPSRVVIEINPEKAGKFGITFSDALLRQATIFRSAEGS